MVGEAVEQALSEADFRRLRQRDRGSSKRIRGWSAPCRTGEEPYSLAMTLLEGIGPEAGAWNARVLATDISTRVLRGAECGVYSAAKVAGIPQPMRTKYLAA